MKEETLITVVLSLVVYLSHAELHVDNKLYFPQEDKGYFNNCGKAEFTLWWSPKVISRSGFVTLGVSLTSKSNWSRGYGAASLNSAGQWSNYSIPLDCGLVETIVTSQCPFTVGEKIEGKFSAPAAFFPPGDSIRVRVEFKDQSNNTLICGDATIATSGAVANFKRLTIDDILVL